MGEIKMNYSPNNLHETSTNFISNRIFIWSLIFYFFSDKSQWTQPLDNSSWNNPYKWMFLVFSPVTHCSVEVYAISVGCEKKRHWQTPGARWSEPKWHVVWMCVKLWLIESVCSCITVSQRPEAVCHIHQGPVLIFYKTCSLYWAKKKKNKRKKTSSF